MEVDVDCALAAETTVGVSSFGDDEVAELVGTNISLRVWWMDGSALLVEWSDETTAEGLDEVTFAVKIVAGVVVD